MKIRVDFTVDLATGSLAEARAFMSTDSNSELGDALRREAADYLVGYLEENLGAAAVLGTAVRASGGYTERLG